MNSKFTRPLAGMVLLGSLVILSLDSPDIVAAGEGRANLTLLANMLAAASGRASSPSYAHSGTLGQAQPIGMSQSAAHVAASGYWPVELQVTVDAPDVPQPVDALFQNHPNPFNPLTEIVFVVHRTTRASLTIYDFQGRRVRTLLDEAVLSGIHAVTWNGRDDAGRQASSGVYFCRLVTVDYQSVKKLTLVK